MGTFKGFLCILLCMLFSHAMPVTSHLKVNLISDIHYDPEYGTVRAFSHCESIRNSHNGEPGCDSPKLLIDSMAEDVSHQNSNFTIYAGDWQRHKFNSLSSVEKLFGDMKASFSSIKTDSLQPVKSFAGAWGNNDVVPDYYFDVTQKEDENLKKRIAILNNTLYSPEESASMIKCAFFARRLQGVTFVTLHSLIWAHTLKPPLKDNVTDPCQQFEFLEKELKFAARNHVKVIIIAHIPPILDIYTVVKNGKFTDLSTDMHWKESFFRRYMRLMILYKDVVSVQLFGHVHMFYYMSFIDTASPAFVIPSISPVFGNFPSYLLATFSDTWELIDINQRMVLNRRWDTMLNVKKVLKFNDGFSNANSARKRIKELFTNDRMWAEFLALHNGGRGTSTLFHGMKVNSFARAVTVCSMLNGIYEDIKKCTTEMVNKSATMEASKRWRRNVITIIGLVVVAGSVVVIIVYFVRRRMRRQESCEQVNTPGPNAYDLASGRYPQAEPPQYQNTASEARGGLNHNQQLYYGKIEPL